MNYILASRKKERTLSSIGRVLILAITVPVRFPVPFLLPEAVAAHFITRFSPFEAVRNKPTALNG